MFYNILFSVFWGISLLIIAGAACLAFSMHRAELRRAEFGSRHILTPFQAFVLFFAISAFFAQFPCAYADAGVSSFWEGVQAFFLGVLRALQMFTLNGDFAAVSDPLSAAVGAGMNGGLSTAYSLYMVVIYLAAPLFTAGFVLSLFREAATHIKYALRFGRDTYMFSSLNERSLALAKDIYLNAGDRRPTVVFADVSEKTCADELIVSAKRLGALCFKKEIVDLGIKNTGGGSGPRTRIYFIGDDEDENISQALLLIGRHKDSGRLEFYVYSVDAESEALLNSIDNGKAKVRRVDENKNLAYKEMLAHPIFERFSLRDGVKHVCIAIVGLGGYGWELLKLICCIGQMPGYSVEVHVFDKEKASEKVRFLAPEFYACSDSTEEGEARYSIRYHDEKNIAQTDFLDELTSIRGLNAVYLTLGDDERNIETALRVRVALGRKLKREEVPPIYAVVYSEAKTAAVTKSSEEDGIPGLKNMRNENYGITFIGSLRDCYSLEAVEQTRLERVAEELHMGWAVKDAEHVRREARSLGEEERKAKEAEVETKLERNRKKFHKYEYFRRCSMGQAIYRELRGQYVNCGEVGIEQLRIAEHNRWETFLRAEGYVRGPRDDLSKQHNLLIPFEELPDSEKEKDDI